MASFSAYLEIEGKKYILVVCIYSFHQHIDYKGRPRSKVKKGPIRIELYAVDGVDELVA